MAFTILPEAPSFANAINTALQAPAVTMTSREIADLTGKQHSNVMRDIRSMLSKLEQHNASLAESQGANSKLNWLCQSSTYVDEQGKSREQYVLDRDTTLTLVAGYDPAVRMRIIKRWQELEGFRASNKSSVPTDPHLAMLFQQSQILMAAIVDLDQVKQEQERLEKRQVMLEATVETTKERIDSLMGGDDYVTVKGFARKNGYPGDRSSLAQIGKLASKMCRANNTTIAKVTDEVWDDVNSYPRDVVKAAFEEYYSKKYVN